MNDAAVSKMAEFIESARKLIISGELENAGVVWRPYSTTIRLIPQSVIFTWVQELADTEWHLSSIEVSGPRAKSDGNPSKNHASAYFGSHPWRNDDPPEWLVDLAGATLATLRGVTND